jgi:phage regulator Rha-like protein
MTNLPAICTDLRLRPESGVPVVNSRDVAAFFEKCHDNVLADIDRILGSPGISGHLWFHETHTANEQNGQLYRSFDLPPQRRQPW